MKLQMGNFSTLAIAISAAIYMSAYSLAEERTTSGNSNGVGQLDQKTLGANIRVSQLIGMNLQNTAGQSVGEINDLVVDGNSGKIRYAAVTYGGFLGIGNKLFAVPFDAFKCNQDVNNKGNHVLVLDVSKEQLQGAVGFDKDHWPDFADEKFLAELHHRYGTKTPMQSRTGGVDVNVDRNRVDVQVSPKK